MTQKPSPKAAAAKHRRKRRSKIRTWVRVLIASSLMLLLIAAGLVGYFSDSEVRAAIETQLEENRQQEELRLALSAEGNEKDARLAAVEKEITDKDAQIEALTADNADKDARIIDLSADRADKDAQIEALTAGLADKDARIDALGTEDTDQDARLQELSDENAGKAAQLETLSADAADKDAQLSALNGELAEKDARIDALSTEGIDKYARIDALNGELADKDARIDALNGEIARKDAEIQAKTEASAGMDGEADALREQIAAAVAQVPENPVFEPAASSDEPQSPQPDAWGYVDEDGDGLILVPIRGKFTGYMLIVLDPSRVVLSCEPKMLGAYGYDVQHFVEKEDGVAGINGGSFSDPGGRGDGSLPDTTIFSHGELYCGGQGMGYYFTGIDDENVLHVGVPTVEEAQALHIRDGCCFRPGPILVKDGELGPEDRLYSGLNPRTAIGQRSDGAILLLAVEGRQPSRIGCSFRDEAELMLRFGAVNASNMDGGSSTMMWYEGEYINNRANVINVRYIPTSWVVLKEGRDSND